VTTYRFIGEVPMDYPTISLHVEPGDVVDLDVCPALAHFEVVNPVAAEAPVTIKE
jgi:hypothetical protein